LLDARAAAEHLGISVAMLRSATAAGEIAHVRLRCRGSGARNAVRWLVADLDGWVLTHRVPAAPDRGRAGRGPIQRHAEPTTSARMVGARGRGAPLLSAREVLRRDGAA
jgi:hypothetical protein